MDISEIRILLLGDDNVGRTSLIYSLVSEDVVPSTNLTGDASLRPTTDDISIPPEVTRARVPTVIMDYCGRQPMSADEIDDLLLPMECPSPNPLLQTSRSLYSCIRQAHVICLVYAFDSRESRDRLLTVWLPLIDRSATTIPIMLVANKCDLIEDEIAEINQENREFFRVTMLKYSRIEACIETSTRTMKNISELFYSAQKCVLYPINYLSEQNNKLSKRFRQCLKRIFTIADQDHDQLLNDQELTTLQDYCFGKISSSDEKTTIEQLKREIKRRTPSGIQILQQSKGSPITALTYQGFECLFELYLNKGKYETIYTTLERFSYNRKLELCVPNPPEDLTGELSPSAIDYLTRLFRRFDSDDDSCLTLNELNQLFESFIELIPPFPSSLSKIQHCIYLRLNQISTSKSPLLTLSAFLAQWFFLAHTQPSLTFSYLFQLGYSYASSTVDDTRLPSRMTYVCHVYGMAEAGKSSFLKRFVSSTIYQVRHSADLAEKLNNNKTKAFFCYDFSSKSSFKQQKFYAVDFVRVLNETKCLILEECHANELEEKVIFPNASVNCFLIDRTHPRAFSNVATIYLQQHQYPRLPCLFIFTKADQLAVKQDYPLPIEFFCRQHKIPLPIDYSAITSQSIYTNLPDANSQIQTTNEHMSQSWFTNLLFRSQANSTRSLEPYSPRGEKTRHQDDIYVRLGYLCVYPKLNYFTNSTNEFYNTDALLKYSLYASVVTLGLVTVARMFR